MATTTYIPVEEYLHTSYRPDVDYVDGELQERNLGEQYHAMIQATIISILRNHRREWSIRPLPEQRVQVSPTRFRVPDLCIVSLTDPVVPILRQAPLLCIEILSRRDSFTGIQARARDYLNMGVPSVWVIDPLLREAWTIDALGIHRAPQELALTGSMVKLTIDEIFEDLDEAPKEAFPEDIDDTLKPGETR